MRKLLLQIYNKKLVPKASAQTDINKTKYAMWKIQLLA
jgi:hypothetical protein